MHIKTQHKDQMVVSIPRTLVIMKADAHSLSLLTHSRNSEESTKGSGKIDGSECHFDYLIITYGKLSKTCESLA